MTVVVFRQSGVSRKSTYSALDVAVLGGIERSEAAIFFRKRAVEIPAQTGGHSQIAADFVIVIDEEAGGIGAVVAVGGAGKFISAV